MPKFFKVSVIEKNFINLKKSYVTISWVDWNEEDEMSRSGVLCQNSNGRFFLNCGKSADRADFIPADFPIDRITCVRFGGEDHFPK